jgi:hypothetical protein
MYKFHEILELTGDYDSFIITNYDELSHAIIHDTVRFANQKGLIYPDGTIVPLTHELLNLAKFEPHITIKVADTIYTDDGQFLIVEVEVPDYQHLNLPSYGAIFITTSQPALQFLAPTLEELASLINKECGINQVNSMDFILPHINTLSKYLD